MQGHAEIAGAGFAGLAAAIALTQRGWTVRVHEKGPQLRAFGAGIFIWENGLRVLRALDAYDALVEGAHDAVIFETRHGNRIISTACFDRAFGSRMLTMTRQHLYGAMLASAERLGVRFVTGSEIVSASTLGTIRTAAGHTYDADLVIGADGVRSNVRDALGLLRERRPCADGIARVLAPRCLDELGPGTWDHVIDFWPQDDSGLRILYVPCNPNELYLAMMAPVNDPEATAVPIRAELWVRSFPQLAPVLRRIYDGGRYDAYETTVLTRWSSGRAAVLGDAGHAMVPTLGQGAGTAMMNALALAVALEAADSVESGLAAWETKERPLTDYTQHHSEQSARLHLMSTGNAWNDETLRTARHVPTGTESIAAF